MTFANMSCSAGSTHFAQSRKVLILFSQEMSFLLTLISSSGYAGRKQKKLAQLAP